MASCRHSGPAQPRLLNGRHEDDCDDSACRGCRICPEPHCAVCTTEHVGHAHPITCPGCVGKVRADLSAVVDLTSHLAAHAVLANGGRMAAAPIPGGEAMVLIGPTGGSGSRSWYAQHPPPEDFGEGPTAPAWVLGNWRIEWEGLTGTPGGQPRTIGGSAAYLADMLSRMSQRPAAKPDAFARDVSSVRYHLEEVLYDGERSAKGAPCVHCGSALVRVPTDPRPCACTRAWGPHAPHNDEVCCRRCRAEERHAAHEQGGLADTWQCLRCRRRYTESEYRYAVNVTYLMHSPTLTAAQLSLKTGTPVGTIRVWGTRGLIRRTGHDSEGRILYDVSSFEARIVAQASEGVLESVGT